MTNNKLQERKTREDTRKAQEELMSIIKHKYLDDPHLSYPEQQKWKNLIDDALLSKGNWKKFIYSVPDPENWEYVRKVNFGNLKNILMRMVLDDFATNKDKNYFYIRYLDINIRINLKHFWRELYKAVVEASSIALDEALHMSAESPKKAKRTSYTWKANDK